jgi:V/A-type H+-transporting ATPase subunit F
LRRIVFVTPPEAEYGFGLSGLTQYTAREGEVEIVVLRIVEEIEMGLIIIDERLLAYISDDRLREIERAWGGIIITLPSPLKPRVEIEDYVARLIKRAIGYHVRLRI